MNSTATDTHVTLTCPQTTCGAALSVPKDATGAERDAWVRKIGVFMLTHKEHIFAVVEEQEPPTQEERDHAEDFAIADPEAVTCLSCTRRIREVTIDDMSAMEGNGDWIDEFGSTICPEGDGVQVHMTEEDAARLDDRI